MKSAKLTLNFADGLNTCETFRFFTLADLGIQLLPVLRKHDKNLPVKVTLEILP